MAPLLLLHLLCGAHQANQVKKKVNKRRAKNHLREQREQERMEEQLAIENSHAAASPQLRQQQNVNQNDQHEEVYRPARPTNDQTRSALRSPGHVTKAFEPPPRSPSSPRPQNARPDPFEDVYRSSGPVGNAKPASRHHEAPPPYDEYQYQPRQHRFRKP